MQNSQGLRLSQPLHNFHRCFPNAFWNTCQVTEPRCVRQARAYFRLDARDESKKRLIEIKNDRGAVAGGGNFLNTFAVQIAPAVEDGKQT